MVAPDLRGEGGEGEGEQICDQARYPARLKVDELDLQRHLN